MTLYYTLVSIDLDLEFRDGISIATPASFHPMMVLLYKRKPEVIAGGSDCDHDVTNTRLTISIGVFSPPRGDGGLHVPHPSTAIHMAQGCFHLHIRKRVCSEVTIWHESMLHPLTPPHSHQGRDFNW